MQTYFNHRISFTNVAEDIMDVVKAVEWERGDFAGHVPTKPYGGVFYIGSFMNIDIARYYRYIWWTNNHVYYGVTEGPPALSLFNYAATKNMRIIVPSKYVEWELENAGIHISGIVPHGVDINAIKFADPRPWREIFGNKTIVLYVAHRNIRKGFRELVNAWKLTAASRDPNVVLVLHTSREPNVNDDGYRIPEEGNIVVTDNILKLDRGSLYGLYQSADVYVHGALCEGFGIPLVEAMAAGKPVVCIDAGPMNEHVKDRRALVKVTGQTIYNDRGVANYRMNIPDIKDYAEKIDAVVYDQYLQKELGEENQEKVREYNKEVTYTYLLKYMNTGNL
jgi:glycosyltransferase involved in cell wall biosynthesis